MTRCYQIEQSESMATYKIESDDISDIEIEKLINERHGYHCGMMKPERKNGFVKVTVFK